MSTVPETEIRPLFDAVLVEPDPPNSVVNGIEVPYMSQKPVEGALVLAVGPGKRADDGSFQDIALKRGDRVRYRSYHGVEIREDGRYLLLLKEEEIFGVEV
jgi:chaperonin GroES